MAGASLPRCTSGLLISRILITTEGIIYAEALNPFPLPDTEGHVFCSFTIFTFISRNLIISEINKLRHVKAALFSLDPSSRDHRAGTHQLMHVRKRTLLTD